MISNLIELEKSEVIQILRQAKVPANWLGYKSIVTAIPMVIDDFIGAEPNTLQHIYKEVAKKHKTTAQKVDCAIRYVHENTAISKVLGYEKISNKLLLYSIAESIVWKLKL